MDEKNILNELSIPKDAWFQRNLPFNQLAKRLTPKQRKICEDTIEAYGIRILATISPSSTNIPAYSNEEQKFEEIHLYAIKLKEWEKQKEIYRIFAQSIPYPLIILFHKENKQEWVLAKHHRHSNGISLVVDKLYQSNEKIAQQKYYSKFNFRTASKVDLKTYYDSLITGMIELEAQEHYQIGEQTVLNEAEVLRLQAIDLEIFKLQQQARKETQVNQRYPLHKQIHLLKQEKNLLIKELEQ